MEPDSTLQLHLLELVNDSEDQAPALLTLPNGNRLSLIKLSISANNTAPIPDYICVSYVWGSDRIANPVQVGPEMISTNTLPALSAAMHNTNHKAFWIDAFCIPTTQPARRATFESMGYIYSQARQVRVALSKHSFQAVRQLTVADKMDEDALATLDQDQWVQSTWTYQEVVNSQTLAFICPGALGEIVDGESFFNGMSYSLRTLNPFSIRERFPSIDTFEDLLADWRIAGYSQRSALAVMSNMDRRVWHEDRNYFHSMIGAVTSQPRWRSWEEPHLSELFMKICEEKKDFSFIYSSATRSIDPARRWRPETGLLPSILTWHSWGESQPGQLDFDGSLTLDRMLTLRRSALSDEAKQFIAKWLHREDLREERELTEQLYKTLIYMGFKGSTEYIPLGVGVYFPQTELASGIQIEAFVSTCIRWTLGAPAIACVMNDGVGTYTPGVFVGIVDETASHSVRLV